MRLIVLRDCTSPRHRLKAFDYIDIDEFEFDEIAVLYAAGMVAIVDDHNCGNGAAANDAIGVADVRSH
jgi:hypothetical protein